MNVFIFCAGKQTRWNKEGFPHPRKHMVPINGVPLVWRTCEQFIYRGFVPIIVSHDILKPDFPHIHPESKVSLAVSIASTTASWRPYERTLLILGDVFFTSNSLNEILANHHSLMFFGHLSDLYAMAFNWSEQETIKRHLESILSASRNGMLWELYRQCCGFPLDNHLLNHFLLRDINDPWTRDFDVCDSWEQFDVELNNSPNKSDILRL